MLVVQRPRVLSAIAVFPCSVMRVRLARSVRRRVVDVIISHVSVWRSIEDVEQR